MVGGWTRWQCCRRGAGRLRLDRALAVECRRTWSSPRTIVVTDPAYAVSKTSLQQLLDSPPSASSSETTNLNNNRTNVKALKHLKDLKSVGSFVGPIRITESLWQRLQQANVGTNFRRASHETDEEYYVLGDPAAVDPTPPITTSSTTMTTSSTTGTTSTTTGTTSSTTGTSPFSAYRYLGTHASDSRMCAVIDMSVLTAADPEDYAVDWDDFVLTTLNDATLQVDRDQFPLYLFFATIPEEDYAMAVFGLPCPQSPPEAPVYTSLVLRSRDVALAQLDALNDMASDASL